MGNLLEIQDLRVRYPSTRGSVRAVDGVSLKLRQAETYALVGESGCGKTATALSILRLVEPGEIVGGRILFEGADLLTLPERELRRYRGGRIGMIFQEPAAALNPVMRVGAQVQEAIRIHKGLRRRESWDEAVRLLGVVALPDPARQARAYPHELSGGMRQRVMIAVALSCEPSLLIADEPTTALDVTVQAQILDLMRRLQQETGTAILLITHNLGVVAETCDDVAVMYAGKIVEKASMRSIFKTPRHPYSQGLLRAVPRLDHPAKQPLPTIPGTVPNPMRLPTGCRFRTRCPWAIERCAVEEPGLIPVESGGAGERPEE